MPARDFPTVLRALQKRGVDFIVVGGLAAVLNGSPKNTFDLDIVLSRIPENVAWPPGVLEALDAICRPQPSRRLKPNAGHLSSPGRQNLLTTCGPLEVLGASDADWAAKPPVAQRCAGSADRYCAGGGTGG